MSEIDEIFSSKKKPSSTVEEGGSSSKKRPLPDTSEPGPSKRRKKDSKKPPGPSKPSKKDSNPNKKCPSPETVVDTSANLPGPSKRRKKDNKKSKPKSPEPTDFEDSRGSGDRRKTDDGWSVYKEDELGLNDEGGDTPLCPFDCNCCF